MESWYIGLEGIDCTGKTTQARLLCDFLTNELYENAVYLKCGGLGGDGVLIKFFSYLVERGLYLDDTQKQFFFESIARLQNRRLRKELRNNRIVVGDKSIWSHKVWEKVNGINRLSQNSTFIHPDIVILLDLDPKYIVERIKNDAAASEIDLAHSLKSLIDYVNVYRDFAENSDNWIVIDGSLSIMEIHKKIRGIIYEYGYH